MRIRKLAHWSVLLVVAAMGLLVFGATQALAYTNQTDTRTATDANARVRVSVTLEWNQVNIQGHSGILGIQTTRYKAHGTILKSGYKISSIKITGAVAANGKTNYLGSTYTSSPHNHGPVTWTFPSPASGHVCTIYPSWSDHWDGIMTSSIYFYSRVRATATIVTSSGAAAGSATAEVKAP